MFFCEIEACSRSLCYKLHQLRLKLHKGFELIYGGSQHAMGGTNLTVSHKALQKFCIPTLWVCLILRQNLRRKEEEGLAARKWFIVHRPRKTGTLLS